MMIRYKTNKQALIIAALVILLCFAFLVGSTFALFSSTSDGKIGVVTTSGSVDVDIVDTSKEENSLVGGVLEFQSYAERDEILFEPGAVFYTQGFKVKNRGTIPVNFRLYVSEDSEINMEEFNKAFEVWISKSQTFSEKAKEITSFKGELGVDKSSDTYYLFVRMKETAGNEFQGKSYSGIGVTVYAVQSNVEIEE